MEGLVGSDHEWAAFAAFVMTSEEFDRSGAEGLALGRTIRETGIDLL